MYYVLFLEEKMEKVGAVNDLCLDHLEHSHDCVSLCGSATKEKG